MIREDRDEREGLAEWFAWSLTPLGLLYPLGAGIYALYVHFWG